MGSTTTKPKVLALGYPDYAGDAYMAEFEKAFTIDVLKPSDRKGTLEGVAAKVKESGPYDALLVLMGIGPYEPFDEEFLKPLLPQCKILVSCSAGYNEFDVPWMTKNGMWFCNTRSAVSEPTADMAIFLILAVLRDTTRGEKQAREGKWRGALPPTRDPTSLTLGIAGMGGIGKHLARKAQVFNMRVKYYNRTQLSAEEEAKYGASYAKSMEELLSQSDVVSINCPLNEKTVGLIGEKEFSQMKDGVFFINTARGPIVDEEALIKALKSGKVARAGLDVFDGEPKINPYFIECDRCTIQPHLGGLTDGAWKAAEIECLENIKSLFSTGKPVAPCEPIGAGCRNCIRAGRDCIIEDPATKRQQPRGYLQSLEERVGMLEGLLAQTYPDLSKDHLHEFESISAHTSNDQNDNGLLADVLSESERNQSDQFSTTTSFVPESLADAQFTPGNHISTPSAVNQSENVDDLFSEIGMLSLQAAGQSPPHPHYFGPGSSFVFSKTVFSHFNRLRSQGPGLSLGGIWDLKMSSMPPAVPAALPSREIGRLLSNAYFENINPQYPILHRPTFNKWEQEVMDARDNATIPPSVASFFVNIVYAVGTLILPHTIDSPAECFYAAAESHFGSLAQTQGLELIQGILCLSMYSIRSAIGVSVWSLSGLALRQCVELGYHRNTRKFRSGQSLIVQQLQRRVFWVAYDLDRCACVTLGRPFGIADSDIDVELPFDINDEALTSHSLLEAPRTNPSDKPTTMTAFLHLTKLRRIWSRIQTDLYPSNPPKNSETTVESRIIAFREELDHWHQIIPPPVPVTAALSTFSTSEWFHLAYNHSKLLLYRRMLTPDAHGGSSYPHIECCTAAREICLLYRKLFLTNPVSYTWGALHILFLAGLTYLHCLISCPDVRSVTRQDDVAHTSTSCTIVLVIMAERWKCAAAYRDTFEMLAKATMSMLVNVAHNAPGEAINNVEQLGWEPAKTQNGSLMGELTNQQGLTELPGYIEDIERVGMCFGTEELLTQFLGQDD